MEKIFSISLRRQVVVFAVGLFVLNLALFYVLNLRQVKNSDASTRKRIGQAQAGSAKTPKIQRFLRSFEEAQKSQLNSQLKGLRNNFLVCVFLFFIQAVAASYFFLKMIFRPLDEMIKSIHRVREDHLKIRVPTLRTLGEVARLGDALNQMLNHLDKSFSSHSRILHDIAHELKTPLTILRGQLEVTLKKTRAVSEYKMVLNSNLEEIVRMRKIIDNLLFLARLDNQTLELELKSTHLNPLVQSVIEDIKIVAEEKTLQIDFFQETEITLKANEDHLKRLVMNLLENAVKYTPKGGKINVKLQTFGRRTTDRVPVLPDGLRPDGPEKIPLRFLENSSQFVIIRVGDTGIGISDKDLPFIFDRFYRVDKVRKSGEGFGLGLSIAQAIVQAHQGFINVQSHFGRGTTFSIYLPWLPTVV